MKFIVDNMVWFIVGGVVILMTIVGYLAEKTDFASKKYHENVGHKKDKRKKEKEKEKEKEKNIVNEEKIEEPDNPISMNQTNIVNEEKQEDLFVPVEPVTNENQQIEDIPSELFAPIENTPSEKNEEVSENENQLEAMSKNEELDNVEPQLDNNTETETLEENMVNVPAETVEVSNETAEPVEQLNVEPVNNVLDSFAQPISSSVEQLDNILPIEEKKSPDAENNSTSQLYDPSLSFENFESAESLQKVDDNGYVNEEFSEATPEVNVVEINNNNEAMNVVPTESFMPNDSTSEISNEEADKIFPDDPVIINDNNQSNENVIVANVDVLEEMPSLNANEPKTEELEEKTDDSNPEDLWKF